MKPDIAPALAAILLATGDMLRPRAEAPNAIVRAELVGVRFAYAGAYARDDATAAGGAVDRLSFLAPVPGFGPLSAKGAGATQTLTQSPTPKDNGPDPGERAATVDARFLVPATLEGPDGLVRRQFEPGSPYDFEELYLATPDGRRFSARCPAPQVSAPNEACLSTFRDGAIDVEPRYTASLLDQWDTLYGRAR